jgi:hypothetical protein
VDVAQWVGIQVEGAGATVIHKTRQPQKTSVASEEGVSYTAGFGLVVDPERRIPSHVIEVALVSSSVEGTDSWVVEHQLVAEFPGLDSGTGADSSPESCKSLARIVKVPVGVGCTLL